MNILSKIVSVRKEQTNLQKKIRGLDEIKSAESFNRKTYSLSKKIKENKKVPPSPARIQSPRKPPPQDHRHPPLRDDQPFD